MPPPVYSQAARDAGIGGRVTVVVLIDKKGKAKVVDSFGPPAPCSDLDNAMSAELRTAAENAASQAVFQPATWKGKPVEKGMTLSFDFDPDEGRSASAGRPLMLRAGYIHGRAIELPLPKYPAKAQSLMGGDVDVQVVVDEQGNVAAAGAVSGHKVFRRATVEAACRAKFKPFVVEGRPARVLGLMAYGYIRVVGRD